MKRILVLAITLIGAVAAFWIFVPRRAPRSPIQIFPVEQAPSSLKQTANCMYLALKTIPGVNQPALKYYVFDGWNHPYVSYLQATSHGELMVTFEAKRFNIANDSYWFLYSSSGPFPPGLNPTLMDTVINRWKQDCNVKAESEAN